jgi:hypothetical protein
MWNQKIFLESVAKIVKRDCGGVQQNFNLRIRHRDAISRWKGGARPALKIICRIVDEFGCGWDWLLTGGVVEPMARSGPAENDILEMVQEILDSDSKEARRELGRMVYRIHEIQFGGNKKMESPKSSMDEDVLIHGV